MRRVKLIMTLFLGLALAGCAKNPPNTIHPGAANSFDSTTADTLADIQTILEGLSAHVNDYPKAVEPLNQARAAYTTFKNDYLLWRCSQGIATTLGPSGAPCPQGTAAAVTQTQVEADKVKTQQAVSAAQAAETGAKQP